MKKTDVNILDPEFVGTLQEKTRQYQEALSYSDYDKWGIAMLVNGMYNEHKSIFAGDKMAYYIECSRVANDGLAIKIFGESGQTLRRWCEVQAAYENVWQSSDFLEMLSFKHLEVAKKLLKDGKIKGLDFALAKSVDMGWSADDLREAYDPPTMPHPYDKLKDTLEWMTTKDAWQFIKDVDRRNECIFYTNVIRKIVATELEKEGKAYE